MSWYSWWTGSLGPRAGRSFKKDDLGSETCANQKVALVVGISGIVGHSLAETLSLPDAPGGPWKVYGLARRSRPNWLDGFPIEYVQCDVLNREQTLNKISALKDVTHLFWVVWVNRETEEENCEDNGKMLNNVVDALLPNAENLEHICLQTGGKHYLGPFDAGIKKRNYEPHEAPFHEDMPRLPVPNFYHTLEDIVFEAANKKKGLTWSVHRPSVILGFSPSSLMNIIGTLCAYAAICKHEGLPFKFPGNKISWERFSDASDANLIAEQEIWAATSREAKNQVFNCSNGDVFNWKMVWKVMAGKFDLSVPPYREGEGFNMAEVMKDKGPVWDQIVQEHNLQPTTLNEVAQWWFADVVLNAPAVNIFSMNKSKEHDFFGFRNTVASFEEWIDKMADASVIPL